MKRRIYHIGISGGKDSTALLLWMVHESRIPHKWMVASFCDTENEAPETYEHIEMLSKTVFPIRHIKTIGFRALTQKHGFFPTKHRRFCTKELKLQPTKLFLEAEARRCRELVAVSGVRRGESPDRSKLPEWGNPLDSYFGLREWRPLIAWQIEDVLAIHQKYNVPLNPLYGKGAQRVGCFPCIFSNKPEIRAVIRHSPERIDYIREWERELKNESGDQTFFASSKIPNDFKTGSYKTAKGRIVSVNTIDDVVRWAKSGKRARGQAPDVDGLFEEQLKDMPARLCLSQTLACE